MKSEMAMRCLGGSVPLGVYEFSPLPQPQTHCLSSSRGMAAGAAALQGSAARALSLSAPSVGGALILSINGAFQRQRRRQLLGSGMEAANVHRAFSLSWTSESGCSEKSKRPVQGSPSRPLSDPFADLAASFLRWLLHTSQQRLLRLMSSNVHMADRYLLTSAKAVNGGEGLARERLMRGWTEGGQRPNLWRRVGRFLTVLGASSMLMGALLYSANGVGVAEALTEENILFLEAWRTIDRAYVDKDFNGQNWFRYRQDALKKLPMNSREQTYDAIRTMLATLDDPFTRLLEPDKFRTLRTGATGAVTGVGLEVGFTGDGAGDLVVVSPVTGGPADLAGVAPGDIIRAIDGMPTAGMGLYDAAQRLQGPLQSQVELKLERHSPGSSSSKAPGSAITVNLIRELINLNPVSWEACSQASPSDPKVGYIRLSTFNQNSTGAVKDAIGQLRESGVTAFVLDIRNNSGGLFPSGIEIAKMWLKGNVVVVYIADSNGVRDIYDSDGKGALATEEPLAVLVNKGTASASEILAGALKDNGRAVILGEPTFGKGKIQSIFELSDGSGLAVTVARYETPAHIDVDRVGILPDRPLPDGVPMEPAAFCAHISGNPDSLNGLRSADLFTPPEVRRPTLTM
eukprot:TRINITY_DN326_c0_g1_i1.p1 TRINITY_DN326_c0_g1~~TRINITY_DN326_c0_g1_i1.p1  ORF type:complete len:629 (-),score=96.52 TRINITY_DN326_c0_g1_i1:216-2102(-)